MSCESARDANARRAPKRLFKSMMRVLAAALTRAAFAAADTTIGNALAHDARYDRTAVYDALYSHGYQLQSLNYSQSHQLLQRIREMSKAVELRTALDIGSSNGFGVQELWAAGLHASGIDLSGQAVAFARKHRADAKTRVKRPLRPARAWARRRGHVLPAGQCCGSSVARPIV